MSHSYLTACRRSWRTRKAVPINRGDPTLRNRASALRRLAATTVLSATFGGLLASGAAAGPIDPPPPPIEQQPVFEEKLGSPTGFAFAGEQVFSGRASASWRDGSIGETAFQLYRKVDTEYSRVQSSNLDPAGALPSHSGDTKGTEYKQRVLNIPSGTTRCYVVVAVKAGVSARRSAPDCVASAPQAPSNLRVTGVSAHEISLDWDDRSDNEDGFEVHYWRSSAPNDVGKRSVPENADALGHYELEVDHAGAEYCADVRSVNSALDRKFYSDSTSEVCVTTTGGQHPANANLAVRTGPYSSPGNCTSPVTWKLTPISLKPGVGISTQVTVDREFNEPTISDGTGDYWCQFDAVQGVRPGTWSVRATTPLWTATCDRSLSAGLNVFNGLLFTQYRQGCANHW